MSERFIVSEESISFSPELETAVVGMRYKVGYQHGYQDALDWCVAKLLRRKSDADYKRQVKLYRTMTREEIEDRFDDLLDEL